MMSGQIHFTDGNSWELVAGDTHSAYLVDSLVTTMQLRRVQTPARRLTISSEPNVALCLSENGESVYCPVSESCVQPINFQLLQISLALALRAQINGAVLLHGALGEWQGHGVILAGKSGTGKTSASQRLGLPWRSLCDELTLVTRTPQGTYSAHPWPTWSRWKPEIPQETWDVHQAVPLRGMFFLRQAQEDRVEPVDTIQAVGLLASSWEQAHFGLPDGLEDHQAAALCRQGFHSVCDLAQSVPASILHFTKTGAFWQKLEQALLM